MACRCPRRSAAQISVIPLGLLSDWKAKPPKAASGGGGGGGGEPGDGNDDGDDDADAAAAAALRPQHHMYYADRVMDVVDGLPKYAGAVRALKGKPGDGKRGGSGKPSLLAKDLLASGEDGAPLAVQIGGQQVPETDG
eukprot:SAG22_NODE_1831_length_3478_cov_1.539805_2_plen_138_part_00